MNLGILYTMSGLEDQIGLAASDTTFFFLNLKTKIEGKKEVS